MRFLVARISRARARARVSKRSRAQIEERLPHPLVPAAIRALISAWRSQRAPRVVVGAVGGERERGGPPVPSGRSRRSTRQTVPSSVIAVSARPAARPGAQVRPARHDLRPVRLALVLVDETEVDVGREVELGAPCLPSAITANPVGVAGRRGDVRGPVARVESRLHHRPGLRQTRRPAPTAPGWSPRDPRPRGGPGGRSAQLAASPAGAR
jgi:hypothetical protein